MKQKALNKIRARRKKRSRAGIVGTAKRPRLSVFRSNRAVYLQLIDDEHQRTLVAASLAELSAAERKKTKKEQASILGERIAKKAKEKGITRAVFDRSRYRYHGRVSAVADGVRRAGISI